MPELRPYQLEAVKEILDKKRVLVADDMGLGKCAESIAAKRAIEKRQGYAAKTLVVCPASVIQHWEDEINVWYKKRDDMPFTVARIHTPTYNFDLQNARNADFVLVGYPTLSSVGTKLGELKGLGFQYGILDEAHNAKNPDSIRSKGAKTLFDSMEYLAILSGTPVPNTVVDVYMLLSLLDPDTFKVNPENPRMVLAHFYHAFRQDPEFVRRVLNEKMLRRTAENYLQEKFPGLKKHSLNVILEGEHRDAYVQVYENDDIKPTLKLIELRKAALDPNLVSPAFLGEKLAERRGNLKSNIYETLDELVSKTVDDKGKLLVFTDFKRGVTGKLQERYKQYGAVVIDGDDADLTSREETRRKFQQDRDCKVLIATTVMDEGVDLTAATDIAHITLPYMPSIIDQRNRRAQRIGEVRKDYVNVHVIKPTIDRLTPTITEGIERLLDDKRRIMAYILQQPFAVTKQDLEEIKNGHSEKSKHLVPLIASPLKTIISHFGQLKGQGHHKIAQHYERYPEEAKYIAQLYAANWEGFYGDNTATLYAKLIELLSTEENLERKLDLASGPFSLSRRISQLVTNLDLNPAMFEAGRILESEGKVVPGNRAVQGSYHQLPFENNSFDLALCSLALHMSKLKVKEGKEEINERELFFREANRVLRPEGYAIITLPHTVIREQDLSSFYSGLSQLGFEVLPFSGFYRGPEDSKFKVYLAGLRKTSEPAKEKIDEKLLSWRMDYQMEQKGRKSKRKTKHSAPKVRKMEPEQVELFFNTRTKKTLEEMVR